MSTCMTRHYWPRLPVNAPGVGLVECCSHWVATAIRAAALWVYPRVAIRLYVASDVENVPDLASRIEGSHGVAGSLRSASTMNVLGEGLAPADFRQTSLVVSSLPGDMLRRYNVQKCSKLLLNRRISAQEKHGLVVVGLRERGVDADSCGLGGSHKHVVLALHARLVSLILKRALSHRRPLRDMLHCRGSDPACGVEDLALERGAPDTNTPTIAQGLHVKNKAADHRNSWERWAAALQTTPSAWAAETRGEGASPSSTPMDRGRPAGPIVAVIVQWVYLFHHTSRGMGAPARERSICLGAATGIKASPGLVHAERKEACAFDRWASQ